MNGLFGALDIAEVPEFPSDGTHEYVIKFPPRVITTAAGKTKLVIEFFLDEEDSPFNGEKYAKWFNLPWIDEGVSSADEFDNTMIKAHNLLKSWLMDLGIPEDEIATFEFSELTGTRVNGYGYARDKWDGSGREYFIKNVKAT